MVLAVILMVLCAMYAAGSLPSSLLEEPVSYAIVVDGGSSGSRIHVFSMYVRKGEMPVLKAEEGVLKVKPGLSSFSDDPTKAGAALQPLFAFAEKYVPRAAQHRTPVMLMATAGLRSVEREAAEMILDSCRTAIRATPFRFEHEWAEVLPGSKEGLYAWIAANYAAGTLSKADPAQTLGVIELGGASMQVTFAPKHVPPKQFREELRVAGARFTVYTHSALGLGQEAAHASHDAALRAASSHNGASRVTTRVPDPCTPRGYGEGRMLIASGGTKATAAGAETGSATGTSTKTKGHGADVGTLTEPSGNFTACREAAGKLLGVGDTCQHERCGVAGSYLPELRGTFLATENFYYTTQFLRLPERATIADVAKAGEDVCASDWVRLAAERRLPEEDLLKYCFSASFIVAVLHDAMGIGLREEIQFSNSVEGTAVDWALGAAIAFAARSAEEEGGGVGGKWGADATRGGIPNGVWWAAVELAAAGLFLSVVVTAAYSTRAATAAGRGGAGRLLELRVRHTLGMSSKGGVTTRIDGKYDIEKGH